MKTTLVHSGSSASLASFLNSETKLNPLGGKRLNGENETGDQNDAAQSQGCWSKFKDSKVAIRTLPILTWGPRYTKEQAIADLIAGLTVGLTVLPQGLAYATVAGLPSIYGLYSSFVGCFVYIFLGSTKAITVGPTAINCVLTRKYTYGRSPQYAVFLCFTTGVVTFLMSIFRLGFISNFISSPVNSAFTSGVSLTIVATQMKSLLGIKFEGEGFVPAIEGLIANIRNIQKWDSLMSLISCSVLFLFKYLPAIFGGIKGKSVVFDRIIWLISTARSIIVITVSTAVVSQLGPDQPFSLVGNIEPGLPEFKPPPFTIFDPADNQTHYFKDIMKEQATAFIAIPLLGVMGHISIAKALSDSARVDATQEILTIGISNLLGCFFSSMPIGGSLSRSTVNYMSGVETPLGGLYTGIIVVLALQFLTPYFYYIPKSSLGAVIVCSVIYMVDLTIVPSMWRSKRMDLIPWAATFVVTTVVGIEIGILTGILISASFLLYYAARPRVKILRGETSSGVEFVLVDLDRSLTFPSVDYIAHEIMKSAKTFGRDGAPVVVDCQHIQFADFTAAEAMRDLVFNLNKQGYTLIFFQMKSSIERIVGAVMECSQTTFILRQTPEDLEELLERGKDSFLY